MLRILHVCQKVLGQVLGQVLQVLHESQLFHCSVYWMFTVNIPYSTNITSQYLTSDGMFCVVPCPGPMPQCSMMMYNYFCNTYTSQPNQILPPPKGNVGPERVCVSALRATGHMLSQQCRKGKGGEQHDEISDVKYWPWLWVCNVFNTLATS